MTLFVLLHGSGDTGWAWHLVQRSLREFGYESVAPDLPTDRSDATWESCADAVVESVGRHEDVVVVGHSAGGFLAPVVADRLDATLQVYVAGMVPRPGETALEWFDNVGWSEAVAASARRDGGRTGDPDPDTAFFHDVPSSLADQAKARERTTSEHLDCLRGPGSRPRLLRGTWSPSETGSSLRRCSDTSPRTVSASARRTRSTPGTAST